MEYSIYKDSQPRETVKKIKGILANLGINIKEDIVPFDYTKSNAPRSIRIFLNGNFNIGTNGKGSNYINSRASGYAEFMERLQNLFLLNKVNGVELNRKIPDKIFFNENQLLNSKIKKIYNDEKILKLFNRILEPNYFSDGEIVMTPWFSLKDNEQVLLPLNIIQYLQGSNGMAAGNTYEEAIVQGISEICERYVMKQVIYNEISLPEIPKNEYLKYDKIKAMVEYIESLGLKIKIKDASLGKNLPVVCSIIECCKEEKIMIRFGSHPNFPVAVERTITEFFQGLDIKPTNEINLQMNYIPDSCIKDKPYVVLQMFHSANYISSKNKLADLFLFNKSNKKYTNNPFLEDGVIYDNKQILKFLLKNIKPITKNEIYIRDVSFLKFPAVYIFIPSMSIIKDIKKDELKHRLKICDLYYSINQKDNVQITKLLDLTHKYILKYGVDINFIKVRILLLYSILKNDYKMINFYLNRSRDLKQKYIVIINDYFKIKEKDRKKIKKKLLEKYNEEDINYIFKIFDTLSLDIISTLLINYKEKEKEKRKKCLDKEIEKIIETLFEAYKNNIPNQNNLKNII